MDARELKIKRGSTLTMGSVLRIMGDAACADWTQVRMGYVVGRQQESGWKG